MKKFLAILLACVMTLALAVPAMADTEYMITVDPDISNGIIMPNYSTGTEGDVITFVISANNGFELESLTVTDDEGSEVDVDFSGNYGTFLMPANNVTVTATFVPESTTTTVNSITATVTAELGQKVYDAVPTFTSDPEDGVEYLGSVTYWYRVPAGVDYDTCDRGLVETVGQDAVFENGYTYFKIITFGAKTGYELIEGETMLYLNSSETFFLAESVYAVQGIVDFTFDGTQQETEEGTTTAATTTTTAAATSTATKTGDSSNAMTYVITLIALVACAGVTVFATKKTK